MAEVSIHDIGNPVSLLNGLANGYVQGSKCLLTSLLTPDCDRADLLNYIFRSLDAGYKGYGGGLAHGFLESMRKFQNIRV